MDGSTSSEDPDDADNLGIGARGARGGNCNDGAGGGDSDTFPEGPPGGGMAYRDASRIISEANTASVLNALREMGLLRPRREAETLGVTGHELSSGLETLSARWTSAQAACAGVSSKHKRGDTELERLKMKQAVVKLIPGILASAKLCRCSY